MAPSLYSVFVRTTYAIREGVSVSTDVIPALDKAHAEKIAEKLNASNSEGSYLRTQAFVIGGASRC